MTFKKLFKRVFRKPFRSQNLRTEEKTAQTPHTQLNVHFDLDSSPIRTTTRSGPLQNNIQGRRLRRSTGNSNLVATYFALESDTTLRSDSFPCFGVPQVRQMSEVRPPCISESLVEDTRAVTVNTIKEDDDVEDADDADVSEYIPSSLFSIYSDDEDSGGASSTGGLYLPSTPGAICTLAPKIAERSSAVMVKEDTCFTAKSSPFISGLPSDVEDLSKTYPERDSDTRAVALNSVEEEDDVADADDADVSEYIPSSLFSIYSDGEDSGTVSSTGGLYLPSVPGAICTLAPKIECPSAVMVKEDTSVTAKSRPFILGLPSDVEDLNKTYPERALNILLQQLLLETTGMSFNRVTRPRPRYAKQRKHQKAAGFMASKIKEEATTAPVVASARHTPLLLLVSRVTEEESFVYVEPALGIQSKDSENFTACINSLRPSANKTFFASGRDFIKKLCTRRHNKSATSTPKKNRIRHR